MTSTPETTEPRIIQGGMGVAISSWRLARAVAREGALGVVSGTALDVIYARRLQEGDPGGHVRWALAQFPVPRIAERVLASYYLEGGKPAQRPYRNVPMFTLQPPAALQELTVAANFCEVLLAKQGHGGPVGINYLRKIELPLPFACLGAMLAGVDYVLVGAGNPAEIPALLRGLARHDDVVLDIRAQGATSADTDISVRCSPRTLLGAGLPPLRRPRFVAIVASHELAAGLAAGPATRPDGFVVEGPSAGGHNAPPRGPRRVDDLGQPVYDARDQVDLAVMAGLGLPFWLAGSYGTPQGLRLALAAGAAGVQVGTAFAFSAESGLADPLKRQVLAQVAAGDVHVVADWRVSPTGFPFKVVQAAGTLSDDEVFAQRQPVCDLGALRTPYRKPDGSIGYRCPAEPTRVYIEHKGGRAANAEGRRCVCNALIATADLPQRRPNGTVEPPLITAGNDFTAVAALIAELPAGQEFYPARAVIDHLHSVPTWVGSGYASHSGVEIPSQEQRA